MTEYFEKAFAALSKKDPFNTWLIVDSAGAVEEVYKKINTPVLSDSVTTLKSFAKHIVSITHPEIRIIDADEQLIIFSKLVEGSFFERNKKRVAATLVNQLLYICSTKKTACTEIPNTSKKHDAIIKIIDEYERWSEENNVCDSFSVMEKAVSVLDAGEFKIGNLIHCKIRPSNKLAEIFFEKIIECADEVIPYYPEEISGVPDILTKEDLIRYKDAKTEIKAVLEKIAELIEDGVSPKEILVLSPSISRTVKLIDEIIPDFFALEGDSIKSLKYYSAEQGISLANIPVVKSALACLSAVTRNFKLEDLEEILLSPFFTNCQAKITAGELRQISIITGVDSKKNEWLSVSKKLGGKDSERFGSKIADVTILIEWLSLEEHKNTLAGHCTAFKYWLRKSGWTDYPLTESANAARNKFLKIIDAMRISASAEEKTELSVFYSYLLRFSLAKFVTKKETDDSFRVAKLASAASIKADYVFIVGLSSDNIPNIPATLPPFSEKETEEIVPDLKTQMFESEMYHFKTALLCARKKLSLSCAAKDNGKNLIPSPFMTRLFNSEPSYEKINLKHSIFENQKKAGTLLRRNESCRGLAGLTSAESVTQRINKELKKYSADFSEIPEVAETFKKYDESYQFAPTTLEAYVKCPFRWYLTYHLKLYSAEEQGSEAILIGLVVHKTLQRFFTEFADSVTEEEKETALEAILKIAVQEFDKIKIGTPEWTAKREWYLGENGLSSIFVKFIENEIKLSKLGWKTPAEFTERKINSKITKDESEMRIYGEIDRVLVNGNDFMIVDYKTGSSFKSELSEGKLLQIPLYAKVFSNSSGMNPLGGFYLKITTKEFAEVNPFKGTTVSEKTDEIISKCFESAEKMRKGLCCTPSKCDDEYCPYRFICRYTFEEESE
ncbi:MAG: PD-(D/E)XK nuclease family protein [Methanocorpusculum sp.]|nr:PD-(D/E)XK nuclease family protein [Methanocorpusculum sp.]